MTDPERAELVRLHQAERDAVMQMLLAVMRRNSIATGHGDTIPDLIRELAAAIHELQKYRFLVQQKQEAMEVLFDLLERHGIDYSHLIP